MLEGAIDYNFFPFWYIVFLRYVVCGFPILRPSRSVTLLYFFFKGCCQEVASSPHGALALPISSTSCVSG